MLNECWSRVCDWVTDTVEKTATQRLSTSPTGRTVRRGLPGLVAYVVAAAVLISHLLFLHMWPQTFSAYLLSTPALAMAILTILAAAILPIASAKLPLYAVTGYVGLAAVQCLLGAFAMSIPGGTENRLMFCLAVVVVSALLCAGLSRALLRRALAALNRKKRDQSEDSEAEADTVSDASGDT